MATHTKTIEYAFPLSTSSVATATARDFTQITVYIPESSPTFRSVTLETSFVDATTATGANTTAILIGIALGAVGRDDATVTQTMTNSGENYSVVVSRDVTSYFSTNWSGTNMTSDCRLTVTGITSINATAKLIITYEYDSSATTRIKTVKIPIDGNTGNLTTSLVALGSNQWPNLSTFLPEASKTYRDIFFQMDIHTGTTAAAASGLNLRYDGTNTISDGSWAHSLNTDTYYRRIDKLLSGTGAPSTNAAHNIEASTGSTTGEPCPCLNGVIVVTYEYDHSSSTTILNSLQIPVMDEAGWIGGTTSGDESRFTREISIQEPGTITLVQSGILTTCIDAGAITLRFNMGSQTDRTFTHATTARAGCISSMRRIDSGASGGAGMTLNRGFNTLVMDWYTTSSTAGNIGSNVSGLLFLNYTSDKHSSGDGVHAHTTHWMIRPNNTGNLVQRLQFTPSTTPIINETNYWIISVGYQILLMTSGTGAGNLGFAFQCEVQSGEAEGAGWRGLYSAIYASDAEMGLSLMWARARSKFKRWPDDPESRLNIETSRDYRFDVNVTSSSLWQASMLLTWHSITYSVSGTISGSSGGTVTVKAHLASDAGSISTGTEIGSTSRSGNGSYSITWYDNTVDVFTEAWESASLIGRSDDDVAA